MSEFKSLGLSQDLLLALSEINYKTPTPIQEKAIPTLLKGTDLLGIAQTGTGKTAAFALPILDRLSPQTRKGSARHIRTLILTPTRELASQILENFNLYGKKLPHKCAVIFGGVSERPQIETLKRGVDVLVAIPGRLLDLVSQKHILLDKVEIFVLDEADRMLDMGFIRDIKKIVPMLPKERQTLLFSATMPESISSLAASILRQPQRIEVTPVSSTVDLIEQKIYCIDKASKAKLLKTILLSEEFFRVLVFTRTKHGANRVATELERARITSAAIHGNKSQGARERALAGFKSGDIKVLVATDIAARGIDVDSVSHVINYDLPNEAESYVHRIGRTARAGRSGIAISFYDQSLDKDLLHSIEKTIKKKIPVLATPALVEIPHTVNNVVQKNNHKPRSNNKPRFHSTKKQGESKKFNDVKRAPSKRH